jgi:hypothetical protein
VNVAVFGAWLALLVALPRPPDKVVRTTRYFGVVVVDHRAHLARRSPCRSCHGEGAVGKLVLPPRIAHERCLGCHWEKARGPTHCHECHLDPASLQPPPAPEDDGDLTALDRLRMKHLH